MPVTRAVRVAMWSGPRNISTALMRSWGARPDAAVTDEPLYAHYLSTLTPEARSVHPAWDQILRSQPTEWREVARRLTGPVPGGKSLWYQKHMAHHLTAGMERGWVLGLRNVLLVREPRDMITSFIKVIPNPTPEDLGLVQQVELFEFIRERTGEAPPVIDSRDVLEDPRGTLAALCARVGVPFDDSMLAWAPGPRPEDGVWAPHWYASVERSTGFAPYRPKNEDVPARLRGVLDACQTLYDHLSAERLRPG
ncbi:MAG: HAD family hydrolase [Phycisphaerales bacterium JB059]